MISVRMHSFGEKLILKMTSRKKDLFLRINKINWHKISVQFCHCLHVWSWPCLKFLIHCALLSGSVMSDSLRPPWTVAHQAPLPMGFSRQEYWNRLPFLPPGDLHNPGMEPEAPVSPALQTTGFLALWAIRETLSFIQKEKIASSLIHKDLRLNETTGNKQKFLFFCFNQLRSVTQFLDLLEYQVIFYLSNLLTIQNS